MLPVIRQIRDRGVAMLMVEHVTQAVMSLCEHTRVLAQGRMIAQGTPAEIAADPKVTEACLGQGAAKRLQGSAAEGAHA